MRNLAAAVLSIVLAFGLVGPAAAASFDCAKATSADEKTICHTCVLAQKDVKMATLYDVLTNLVAMGQRGDLQDQQRSFLKTRAACGSDEHCIAKAYDARIAKLEAGLKEIYAGGPY
ncbi:MAG: hypothetical protein RIC87_09835 [Kiloniellales bacterium]